MEYKEALDIIKAAACCQVTGGLCKACPFKNSEKCTHTIFNSETIIDTLNILDNIQYESYLLKIYIDSDEDFYYSDDVYTEHGEVQMYFSDSREELCKLIKRSINNITLSVSEKNEKISNPYYIVEYFEMVNSKIDLVCKYFDTFVIEKSDADIRFELLKIQYENINDVKTYREKNPSIDFGIFSLQDFNFEKYKNKEIK